jgi:hypothetical protein
VKKQRKKENRDTPFRFLLAASHPDAIVRIATIVNPRYTIQSVRFKDMLEKSLTVFRKMSYCQVY